MPSSATQPTSTPQPLVQLHAQASAALKAASFKSHYRQVHVLDGTGRQVNPSGRVQSSVAHSEKTRYRGIAKNHNRLCAYFALVNLYLHRKRLAPLGA